MFMPAVFEIELFNRRPCYRRLLTAARNAGHRVVFDPVTCMEDWQYNNGQPLPEDVLYDEDALEKLLRSGKILFAPCTVDDVHKAGMFVYQKSGLCRESFWVSTKNLPALGCAAVTPDNEGLYADVTRLLLQSVREEDFLLGGMGVEVYAPETADSEEFIRGSSNFTRWLAPSSNILSPLRAYGCRETRGWATVFSVCEG